MTSQNVLERLGRLVGNVERHFPLHLESGISHSGISQSGILWNLSIWSLSIWDLSIWNLPISQFGIWNLESSDVCTMGATMRVADTTHASQRTANIAHPSQQRRKNPGARCPRLAESNLGELPLRILSGKQFFPEIREEVGFSLPLLRGLRSRKCIFRKHPPRALPPRRIARSRRVRTIRLLKSLTS